MSIKEVTQLHSIEILFPFRAINARWDTYIAKDGENVYGPSIHRKAYPADDISEILPEISQFVSKDYLKLVAQTAQQAQQIAQLQAAVVEHQDRNAELEIRYRDYVAVLEAAVAQRDARITKLEAMPPSLQEDVA